MTGCVKTGRLMISQAAVAIQYRRYLFHQNYSILLFKTRPLLSNIHVHSSSTLTMTNCKDARGNTLVSLARGNKPSICAGLQL